VTGMTQPAYRYDLETCTNLLTQEWSDLIPPFAGDGLKHRQIVPTHLEPRKFYRLRMTSDLELAVKTEGLRGKP
jgi:hypothetical protein